MILPEFVWTLRHIYSFLCHCYPRDGSRMEAGGQGNGQSRLSLFRVYMKENISLKPIPDWDQMELPKPSEVVDVENMMDIENLGKKTREFPHYRL